MLSAHFNLKCAKEKICTKKAKKWKPHKRQLSVQYFLHKEKRYVQSIEKNQKLVRLPLKKK